MHGWKFFITFLLSVSFSNLIFSKYNFRNIIRVSKSLNPGQAWCSVMSCPALVYFLLSYTYTSIALDARLLAQAYRPSQIELSSPGIQKSCRGLIRGLIPGLIFFWPALPSSWSHPGEKNIVEREMSVFWDDHALLDTSMRLSDYVLQTILVNIISLAIAFFPFTRWLTEISKWLPNSYD